MGDAGEGLVDAEARIQERMEERERERAERRAAVEIDGEAVRRLESLRLTRADLVRQLNSASHDRRRAALGEALADLDRQIADTQARLDSPARE